MALPADGYISSSSRTTGEFKTGMDDIVTDVARGNPEYVSTRTFEKGAKCKASNDVTYTSLKDGNLNNTPQADDGTNWYASTYDNVLGLWEDLTGSVSIGHGIYHLGVLWRVIVDISDVGSEEPSSSNSNYSDIAGITDKLDKAGLELLTGSATFTNSTNNINMTGIGLLGLEIGDVIGIAGTTSNDKYFTVEILTDDDNIVVNYEHRGGTTSKSLVDETATVTVSLIGKWNTAGLGTGQGSCTPNTSRLSGASYTNNTNRTIFVQVFSLNNSFSGVFTIDGESITYTSPSTSAYSLQSVQVPVPAGSVYSCTYTDSITSHIWKETR